MVWHGDCTRLFIGGCWTAPASDASFEVISPFTEQVIARVPAASRADVDCAVSEARGAFDHGPWRAMALSERSEVLRRVSAELAERQEDVAKLVSDEMGCPITLSRRMQAAGPRVLLDSFLEFAPEYAWSTVRRSATGNALVTREPVGVVAAIVPWNAPMLVTMLKLAPALLAGCTVVLKPSPEAPLDSYLFAEILEAAGLPEGVVNILPADREVSEYLVTHPDVDKVSFTGSTGAGKKIAALCAHDMRRVTLELGGKSAAVVLDDADLDTVVPQIRAFSLRNNGQACSNKTRIVVQRSRKDELLDRLVTMVQSMQIGDPADPATEIGPVVSARQRAVVEDYIECGREEGAKILTGGGRPAGLDRGWFVEPTIFTDARPDMRIAQEEIFGPVLTVLTFEDEKQAAVIANNSTYGLNGSVFTADDQHALDFGRKIRTGTVELNGNGVGFHAPIGGVKCSGVGREAGLEGFDSYVEMKSYGLSQDLADTLG